MILAALLLLAQDVPAAPPPEVEGVEEIVVQATYGTTTMLFDKGADNRLRNCRIMVSSGSQRRDTNACQATPVCYARTAEIVTECVELTAIESVVPGAAESVGKTGPAVFEMPKLVQPKPVQTVTIGPVDAGESKDSERQRVKLPPLPKDKSNEPVIRITTKHVEDK
ncbi:MAG: hypothetical protein EOP59_03430 [Sphingomonadales bacterium]|nr:MAG: hypothetical protein EOP59_03430 [Sphingomonadales bacterium]